jgi:hypothetical protein
MTVVATLSDCAELLKHAKPFLCLIVQAGLRVRPRASAILLKAVHTEQRDMLVLR